jgi:hypothetical protein
MSDNKIILNKSAGHSARKAHEKLLKSLEIMQKFGQSALLDFA